MFTWISEVLLLASMIFGKTKDCGELNQLIVMKYFPFKFTKKPYHCMMWCGRLIVNANISQDDLSKDDINHEKGHVKQAKYYKYWIQYYLVYLFEWLKGNPFQKPMISAYNTIPFEVQAIANEDNEDYDYNREDLKSKYTLINRKELYLAHEADWDKYVKTL